MGSKPERLDKFAANQTGLSRSEIRTLLKKGLVTVNGLAEKDAERKISPDTDCIAVNGEEVSYRKFMYIMLNKPAGVVCSTRDGLSPTVLSLVPEKFQRKGLFPAGRLDKDTEGFVLITDDGALSHRMLSPKSHVGKLYYCELENPPEEGYAERFEEGMVLRDGEKCLPAQFFAGKEGNSAYVVLREGMFHQVKRMFETVGNRVVFLKRLRIGGLWLDEKLAPGECREILHKEILRVLEDISTENLDFAELVKFSSN